MPVGSDRCVRATWDPRRRVRRSHRPRGHRLCARDRDAAAHVDHDQIADLLVEGVVITQSDHRAAARTEKVNESSSSAANAGSARMAGQRPHFVDHRRINDEGRKQRSPGQAVSWASGGCRELQGCSPSLLHARKTRADVRALTRSTPPGISFRNVTAARNHRAALLRDARTLRELRRPRRGGTRLIGPAQATARTPLSCGRSSPQARHSSPR